MVRTCGKTAFSCPLWFLVRYLVSNQRFPLQWSKCSYISKFGPQGHDLVSPPRSRYTHTNSDDSTLNSCNIQSTNALMLQQYNFQTAVLHNDVATLKLLLLHIATDFVVAGDPQHRGSPDVEGRSCPSHLFRQNRLKHQNNSWWVRI